MNEYRYVTSGDLDGDYANRFALRAATQLCFSLPFSTFGYTYNDIESAVKNRVGEVDIYHANHHGSAHTFYILLTMR